MVDSETGLAPRECAACRLALTFRIDGDLRFISHADTLRMFHRAFARAALPVRFSQGFNPQPRASLPYPRPVGVASEDELLVVEFDKELAPADARSRLAARLPDGINLLSSRALQPGESPQPDVASYVLVPDDSVSPETLASHVEQLKQQETIEISRQDHKTKRVRRIDAKAYLLALACGEGEITFDIRVTQQGTVKPAEIAGLLGFDETSINHRIRRIRVTWQ